MDIEWTEVGVGNLQHKSKYVTLTLYPRISFYASSVMFLGCFVHIVVAFCVLTTSY